MPNFRRNPPPGPMASMVNQKTAFFRNSKLNEIKKLVEIAEELARSHDELQERVEVLEKRLGEGAPEVIG